MISQNSGKALASPSGRISGKVCEVQTAGPAFPAHLTTGGKEGGCNGVMSSSFGRDDVTRRDHCQNYLGSNRRPVP